MGLNVGVELGAAGGAVAHVELQHAGAALVCLDICDDGVGLGTAAAAMHGYVKPVGGELVGDGAANAAAGTRHKNAAAHVVRLP